MGKTDDCEFTLYFSPSLNHCVILTGSLPDPGGIFTWAVTTRDAFNKHPKSMVFL